MTQRSFYVISVLFGIICTLLVWNNMANNPRWALDKGPGAGKLPRVIVAEYMNSAYKEGRGKYAYENYMHAKVKDFAQETFDKENNTAKNFELKAVIAEGLNVAVWYCLEQESKNALEVFEIYRTRGSRIVERYRPAVKELASAKCDAVDEKQFIGGKLPSFRMN